MGGRANDLSRHTGGKTTPVPTEPGAPKPARTLAITHTAVPPPRILTHCPERRLHFQLPNPPKNEPPIVKTQKTKTFIFFLPPSRPRLPSSLRNDSTVVGASVAVFECGWPADEIIFVACLCATMPPALGSIQERETVFCSAAGLRHSVVPASFLAVARWQQQR